MGLFSLLSAAAFFAASAIAAGRFMAFRDSIRRHPENLGDKVCNTEEHGVCIFWDEGVSRLCGNYPELENDRRKAVVAMILAGAMPIVYGLVVGAVAVVSGSTPLQ